MSPADAGDQGALLVLAALILTIAAIASLGVYSVIERTQTEVVRSESAEFVDLFLELRLHILQAYDTAPPAGYNTSHVGHIKMVTGPLLLDARSNGFDVNLTLAKPGAVGPGDQELSWVTGGAYDGLVFGDRDVSGASYDGENDGIVYVEDALVGVLVRVSMVDLDGRMEETLAVPVR